jgi:hypothetical protein
MGGGGEGSGGNWRLGIGKWRGLALGTTFCHMPLSRVH